MLVVLLFLLTEQVLPSSCPCGSTSGGELAAVALETVLRSAKEAVTLQASLASCAARVFASWDRWLLKNREAVLGGRGSECHCGAELLLDRLQLLDLGCHGTQYVPNARGWYAHPVRTVRGALEASRPARPVRTQRGRLVRVAPYVPNGGPGAYASAQLLDRLVQLARDVVVSAWLVHSACPSQPRVPAAQQSSRRFVPQLRRQQHEQADRQEEQHAHGVGAEAAPAAEPA